MRIVVEQLADEQDCKAELAGEQDCKVELAFAGSLDMEPEQNGWEEELVDRHVVAIVFEAMGSRH